jgi:hypothetical protein
VLLMIGSSAFLMVGSSVLIMIASSAPAEWKSQEHRI